MKIIILRAFATWVLWLKTADGWTLHDDRMLAKQIAGYRDMHDTARRKALNRLLAEADDIFKARVPACLPNIKRSDAAVKSLSDYRSGCAAFLHLTMLFAAENAGCILVSYLLAGLHAEALRRYAPDIRFGISVADRSEGIADIIQAIVKSVVDRARWHGRHCRITRSAVLDCRNSNPLIGNKPLDFTCVRLNAHHKLRTPAFYSDTAACILGADSTFLREVEPYMRDACVFLVGCSANDWGAMRLSSGDLSWYDPAVLNGLQEQRQQIAAVLHEWWQALDDEAAWAANIVAQAKASFGKPDSRYVAVTLNPKQLRDAVAYRVLLSFLDFAVEQNWLAAEDADHYRTVAKSAFDPEPIEQVPVQRMEQPDVFRQIMDRMIEECSAKIVPLSERFVKADKPLAAYREISGELYLVMLETAWARWYLRAARKAGVDTSFAQQPNWEREMQKLLCEADMIKTPSSGYRYRYDLYGNGSRDSTYVIALPVHR